MEDLCDTLYAKPDEKVMVKGMDKKVYQAEETREMLKGENMGRRRRLFKIWRLVMVEAASEGLGFFSCIDQL